MDMLGSGLPIEERLIVPLAAFLQNNMSKIRPFQILCAWHAFAHRKSVQPEFEAAAAVYLGGYMEQPDGLDDIFSKGKAKDIQQLWRHHGRAFKFPLPVQTAVDSLCQVGTYVSSLATLHKFLIFRGLTDIESITNALCSEHDL